MRVNLPLEDRDLLPCSLDGVGAGDEAQRRVLLVHDGHRCLNYRSNGSGGLLAWEFEQRGRPLDVRVEGPLVLNDGDLLLEAARAGHGLAYVYADAVVADVAAGRLTRVLEKWCPPFPGYFLYHPSRRQTPPALSAFVAALRHHEPPRR